jgi:acyl-CoA thioesterase-1
VSLGLGGLLLVAGCDRAPQVSLDPNGTNAVREAPPNLYRATDTQIIALGDSITAGAGVGPESAYPQLLSQTIDLPILNRGRGGDTTATALGRLQPDVMAADPWLVIVGLGGNDFLRRVPLDETEENLRQIVTRLQQQGVIVVLLGMNVYPFNGEYEALYERVANDTQAHLIPGVLEGLNDTPYLYDQIHPNQAGHQILADRVAAGLLPLLEVAPLPANLAN